MKKRIIYFFIILLVLTTAGCSINNLTLSPRILEPPSLSITIGNETISPVLGSYSWSDRGEGIEASSDAPPYLITYQNLVQVNSSDQVTFDFAMAPHRYQIREWDTDGDITGTFSELDLSEHSGMKVFDILAEWQKGTASYIFYINVE